MPGDPAPDFTAPTSDGRTLTLSTLRGKTVVLFFFPRAFTPGCTEEAKRFADLHSEFQDAGAHVIGISTDPIARQCKFADSLSLPYPLVADTTKKISRDYGVLHWVGFFDRRVTLVIDPEGVVKSVIQDAPAAEHAARAKGAVD
jgi:peroxiredoxin Q/BCP